MTARGRLPPRPRAVPGSAVPGGAGTTAGPAAGSGAAPPRTTAHRRPARAAPPSGARGHRPRTASARRDRPRLPGAARQAGPRTGPPRATSPAARGRTAAARDDRGPLGARTGPRRQPRLPARPGPRRPHRPLDSAGLRRAATRTSFDAALAALRDGDPGPAGWDRCLALAADHPHALELTGRSYLAHDAVDPPPAHRQVVAALRERGTSTAALIAVMIVGACCTRTQWAAPGRTNWPRWPATRPRASPRPPSSPGWGDPRPRQVPPADPAAGAGDAARCRGRDPVTAPGTWPRPRHRARRRTGTVRGR